MGRLPKTIAIAGGLVGALVLGALVLTECTQNPVQRSPTSARKINDTHWVIQKSLRDDYFKDQAALNRHIRLKPQMGPGPDSVTDLKIDLVSPESPEFTAGFRAGDRVLKINESPVTTLSRAINLAHEIRTSSRLAVQVERNGKIVDYLFEFE